jgi:hypothetical protein
MEGGRPDVPVPRKAKAEYAKLRDTADSVGFSVAKGGFVRGSKVVSASLLVWPTSKDGRARQLQLCRH